MHYGLGYGSPLLLIVIMGITVAAGPDLYVRKSKQGEVTACFLSSDGVYAMMVPGVMVAVTNLAITARALYIAHKAAARR